MDQIFLELFIDFLKLLAPHRMIVQKVVVLFDNVGDFGRSQTVCEDLRLSLHFLHQLRVFVDHFADLSFQVGPYLLLILDNVLRFV